MKRLSTRGRAIVLGVLFYALIFSAVLLGAAIQARANEAPGTICKSLDRVLSAAQDHGTAWRRIDDAQAMDRARDLFEAMPPLMARPRGEWLILLDSQGDLLFGFVTGTAVCDMALVPSRLAPAVRRFILGGDPA